MLRKLKIKFTLAAVLSIAVVITVLLGAINIVNYRNVISDADITLQLIAEHKGRFPSKLGIKPNMDIEITPETPYESRYFSVEYENGQIKSVNTASIRAVDDDMAIIIASNVTKREKTKGFFENYRYLITTDENNTRVDFLDCTRSLNSANSFLFLSISAAILVIWIVFVLIWIISDRIVKPFLDGYEKQKQFITNAGHDIKTPITIIDADAELIEMELGGSEWLTDIRKQTARLTSLTSDLIYLSRMEENEMAPHVDFPLSEIVEEVVNSFSAPAKMKDIKMNISITPALYYCGDENAIRKLLNVLLDNAVKYAPKGDSIEIVVKKQGRAVNIKISNTAQNVTDEMVEHMFDRFFRSDRSRSSSGGFGIGLSVASAIVSSHKGKISAHKEDDLLVFDILLS